MTDAPPGYKDSAYPQYSYNYEEFYAPQNQPPLLHIPHAGYNQQIYPPASYPSNTVIIDQPLTVDAKYFRHAPVQTKCPSCQSIIVTSIHHEVGLLPWILCFVTAIVGCFLGCCLIPFFVDGCKDVIHTCPNCQHMLGRFRRM